MLYKPLRIVVQKLIRNGGVQSALTAAITGVIGCQTKAHISAKDTETNGSFVGGRGLARDDGRSSRAASRALIYPRNQTVPAAMESTPSPSHDSWQASEFGRTLLGVCHRGLASVSRACGHNSARVRVRVCTRCQSDIARAAL